MPFIGKDWRAPGDTWVRVNHVNHTAGWELIKLRPIQLNSFPPSRGNSAIFIPDAADPLADLLSDQQEAITTGKRREEEDTDSESPPPLCFPLKRNNSGSPPAKVLAISTSSSSSMVLLDDGCGNSEGAERMMHLNNSNVENCGPDGGGLVLIDGAADSPPPAPSAAGEQSCSEQETNDDDEEADLDHWAQPFCFVKPKNRTKEFIGCTSMNEAFHRLDIARAVVDIRRFNYICKVVQILVNEKLQNLSASSRKSLFAIIQAMVLHSMDQDVHVSTTKDILNKFTSGLDSPHVCGSPQLVTQQLGTCSNLLDLIARISPPHILSEANPDSITFLDLPREVLSLILSKLPDHVSLLEAAKASETLEALVESEQRQWRTLTTFHFTQVQIDKHLKPDQNWRQLFFELKKYYGLRETYADLIHICCHCKALFWKDHGHPCVSRDAPSVRVTPAQFVDMLLFL